jgi:Exostosin family
MKLLITTTDKENLDCGEREVSRLLKSVADCPFKIHEAVESTQEADAIIFIHRGKIKGNNLLSTHFSKSFLLCGADIPIDYMRGMYTCMPRNRFNPTRHHACGYMTPVNEFIEELFLKSNCEPDIIFSFMGFPNSLLRKKMFRKNFFANLPNILIENTSHFNVWDSSILEKDKIKKYYASILDRSQFVLCPLGNGTATYRLYETMQMGRVPIIISDQWVPPAGPAWQEFSIRVSQDRITEIPEILNAFKYRYAEMGKLARQAWERWFAPNVQFHRIAEYASDLMYMGQKANEFDIYSATFLEDIDNSRIKIRSIAKSAVLRLIKQPLVESLLKNKVG